ncbi:MAG: DUF1295 domain-containing protein [Gemmatimonadaceae bacterium]
MLDLRAALVAVALMAALAVGGWLLSLVRRDVSLVDSVWSLFFLAGAVGYACLVGVAADDRRAVVVLVLVSLWAVRLSVYLTWRNWGAPEDRRYAAMRAARGRAFAWKSLYVVFLLQAALAALISAPLLVALGGTRPLGALDVAGIGLWTVGFTFEAVGDWQLARFKSDPANAHQVFDRGLWRYTRHPNYFGEAVLWWGYFVIAVAAGGWWTVYAPLLMTLLLLKVSGVSLLEKDIHERRPAYRDYRARTNAFIPWVPR